MPDPGPIPIQFGPYRIREFLGEGSFARVYRAEFQGPWNFRKEVALKIVHHRISAANERFFRSLVNEARLGGLLKHPNIIEVYECGQVGDRCYIAMEYVDGTNLREVLSRTGALPRGAVLEIGIQSCRGLHHAHQVSQGGTSLDLVHRDVKPDNFMISRQDLVKIMDFGIAKARLNMYQTAPGGITRGTPLYMSPEQIAGRELTRRSDIFALGAVLGELACGRPIFEDDNLMAILNRALRCDVEPGLARVEAAFADLVPVLRRCLAPDPEDRYPTAESLAADLLALKARYPWNGRLSSLLSGTPRTQPEVDLLEPPVRDDLGPGARTRAFFSTLPHDEDGVQPADGGDLEVLPASTHTIEQLALQARPVVQELSLEPPQVSLEPAPPEDEGDEEADLSVPRGVERLVAAEREALAARWAGAPGGMDTPSLPPPTFVPGPEEEEEPPVRVGTPEVVPAQSGGGMAPEGRAACADGRAGRRDPAPPRRPGWRRAPGRTPARAAGGRGGSARGGRGCGRSRSGPGFRGAGRFGPGGDRGGGAAGGGRGGPRRCAGPARWPCSSPVASAGLGCGPVPPPGTGRGPDGAGDPRRARAAGRRPDRHVLLDGAVDAPGHRRGVLLSGCPLRGHRPRGAHPPPADGGPGDHLRRSRGALGPPSDHRGAPRRRGADHRADL